MAMKRHCQKSIERGNWTYRYSSTTKNPNVENGYEILSIRFKTEKVGEDGEQAFKDAVKRFLDYELPEMLSKDHNSKSEG